VKERHGLLYVGFGFCLYLHLGFAGLSSSCWFSPNLLKAEC
jgi:hypothetical protein